MSLNNVEITKVRPTKYNPNAKGYDVAFDCVGGCEKKQSRHSNAATKDAALLDVIQRVDDDRMCYECAEKAKPVEQKIADRIAEAMREIKRRRECIVREFEQCNRNVAEELARMSEHPKYISGVNQMTNWTLVHAKKAEELAVDIDKKLGEIAVLKSLVPADVLTLLMPCIDCYRAKCRCPKPVEPEVQQPAVVEVAQ